MSGKLVKVTIKVAEYNNYIMEKTGQKSQTNKRKSPNIFPGIIIFYQKNISVKKRINQELTLKSTLCNFVS